MAPIDTILDRAVWMGKSNCNGIRRLVHEATDGFCPVLPVNILCASVSECCTQMPVRLKLTAFVELCEILYQLYNRKKSEIEEGSHDD